ncbi:Bug family tripartite tricarboxylate transporter substrate binding protein [Agaricicola taiwanensis]|nr:tripartite tricarboxylate transporter substrate-binding protein [Agaricicola taiwanensis]
MAEVLLRILIGFSPRSASDDLLRLMEPELVAAFARPVRLELMPGQQGALAAREAISSAPDGNTLLIATFGTHAIIPTLKPDLGYDPIVDFTPVCLATRAPLVLGVSTDLGVTCVEDLVTLARRRELTQGSSGIGSAPYLAGLLFQRMTGVTLAHRAYTDTRDLYEDFLGGRLDLSFNNAASMLPLVRGGRLSALAVTTSQRIAALPAIPTLEECGLSGYSLNNWLGFVAPPRTDPAIVAQQSRAIGMALRRPVIADALARDGIEIVGGTPGEFAAFIAAELERWSWLRSA